MNKSYEEIPYCPYPNIDGVSIVRANGNSYLQVKMNQDLKLLQIKKNGYIPKSGLLFKNVLPQIVKNKRILDLGCGELGIISILALMSGATDVCAIDIDPASIEWLKKIKSQNNLKKLHISCGDMMKDLSDKKFDVIVSNPPIMPIPNCKGKIHDSGGPDGRRYLLDILYQCHSHLSDNGTLLLLAFAFLGTCKRTNGEKSLFETALSVGFKDVRIIKSVDKEIISGSVTYQQLKYIQSIYPKYKFKQKNGKVYNTIQIMQFSKVRD